MKVLVVAETRMYRDGLAEALSLLPDVEGATTAANGAMAVLAVHRDQCDVVVLDMAIESSFNLAAAVANARPELRVVALGAREEGSDVVACAESGVSGYVSRDASFDDLVAALRAAVRGEVMCSGKVVAGLIHYIASHAGANREPAGFDDLTRREREVLRLIEADMSNKEIARTLGIELSTVKNHVHSVLTKLGVTGRQNIAAALGHFDMNLNGSSHRSSSRSFAPVTPVNSDSSA